MLEKIGLPPKPSQRGSNWVVDASHCQGCSSQFTFINRKHHCRRCGGLFCHGCTQQRMVLRGQGDSPVRICEPCKKLEEASRFEMRYGHKNRVGKGSSRLIAKSEDEVLNQILGNDGIESSHMVSSIESASCTASGSTAQVAASMDEAAIHRSSSVDEAFHVNSELGSSSPDKLRLRALDEKKRYKILKGEGKSDEALKAFKRGKELEREADALELSIRKNRKKSLPSGYRAEIQSKDGPKESGRKGKLLDQVGKEKVDLTAELRELGWSDMDVQEGGKGSANMSLEGELSSLLGDVSQRANKDMGTGGVDKTQVIAHKRKALTLKREGKLAEAKEELKKAKVLERQLEEQELLGVAEDSDDEISALIRGMDSGKQDELLVGAEAKQEHDLDFNHLIGTPDDLGAVGDFDVTDEDMVDPEIVDTLRSLGWIDGSDSHEKVGTESVSVLREALLSEILSLKKEALNQKRAGNVAEAMAQLKKAKLLERDLESLGGEEGNVVAVTSDTMQKGSTPQRISAKKEVDTKVAPRSRLMIQKELLALKKKALALRREGKVDEAEEELKRGKVLEEQLEEMNNVSKVETTHVNVGGVNPDLEHEYSGSTAVEEAGEEQVTDKDMYDPTYLSILRNLGWKDDNELANSTAKPSKENDYNSLSVGQSLVTQASSNVTTWSSRSSKADIQRELLSLKRKALKLRREGKVSEAEEVLRTAKTLEAQMADIETPQKDAPVESGWHKHETVGPLATEVGEGDGDNVTDNDMCDPSLLSVLTDLGWKDEELEPGIARVPPSNTASASLVLSMDQYPNPHPPIISAVRPKSKLKVQQELLGLKRKALAFRRKGETEEAEELLKMARVLEAQMEEMEVSESELLPDACKEQDSASLNPVLKHVKQASVKNVEENVEEVATVAVLPDDKCVDSFMGFGSNTGAHPSMSSNSVIPVEPQLIVDNHPLVRESHTLEESGVLSVATTISGTGFVPPANQSVSMMDLLTGDDWRAYQMPTEKPADKVNSDSSVQVRSINKASEDLGSKKHEVSSVTVTSSGTGISFTPDPHTHVGSSMSPPKSLASKTKEGEEPADREKKQHVDETKSSLGMALQINQSSLRQEVLAKKRKALALKRDGKLIEAREELRQAKLLEKGLEEETRKTETIIHASSTSGSSAPVHQKEPLVPNVSPKPLSGRDRFKLQQESLSHKRQALKLRREGRVEEAEAEFDLAKALEAQLDELTSQDSKKSSNEPESADGVIVDDFLDPQLLSALKAIGIHDDNIVSQGQEIHSKKVNPSKSENISQERIQLEERIKAEKLKAVNLKRSGKQAEALHALRQAKMFEKKLDSLS